MLIDVDGFYFDDSFLTIVDIGFVNLLFHSSTFLFLININVKHVRELNHSSKNTIIDNRNKT